MYKNKIIQLCQLKKKHFFIKNPKEKHEKNAFFLIIFWNCLNLTFFLLSDRKKGISGSLNSVDNDAMLSGRGAWWLKDCPQS